MAHVSPSTRASATIPASAGIGLRAPHDREALATRPPVGWFEVHSENYFGQGGASLSLLERIRTDYPVSLHGVGLSLGSADALDRRHLKRLKALIARIEPCLVSEHLSWNSFGGVYLNDLIPLPYGEEALTHMVSRIGRVQDFLGHRILIENPASYLEFRPSTMPESAFLAETARRSGCDILLDLNNLYVSSINHGWDAIAYLQDIPAALVEEVHLAGHARHRFGDAELCIDTHDRPIPGDVWDLYEYALTRFGPRPTLIEWDAEIPPLQALMNEAREADRRMERNHERAA